VHAVRCWFEVKNGRGKRRKTRNGESNKEWTRGGSVSGKAEGARKRGYEIMSVERRRQMYARAGSRENAVGKEHPGNKAEYRVVMNSREHTNRRCGLAPGTKEGRKRVESEWRA
jgi:hypothetical protein